MNSPLLNIAIVLALILLEACFVASEIALISLREGQVRAMAERGRRGQAVARLVKYPNRFLATVQIGVTLTALLSSAFGAVTLSDQAKDALVRLGMASGLAGVLGFIGVTLIISFVTLVVGELVPKRLGLQRPVATAALFSPTLNRVAAICRPIIWLLSRSTDALVRVLGGDPSTGREAISEEELRGLVAAHESLSTDERRLIDDVFEASEHSVSEVMVSRTEVTFLEASMTVSRASKLAMQAPHSRYPVIDGTQDEVRGFVHIRDLLFGDARGDRVRRVGDLVREVKRVPGSKNVLAALSEMRREGHHLAIVVDEYGGTDGIVTLEDLIEEVIGDIRDEYDADVTEPRRLIDGAVEVDGRLNLDEFAESTGLELPEGPYETAGGFVMAALGRLPAVGDEVTYDGFQLAVTAVDGHRTASVRVTPPPSVGDPNQAEAAGGATGGAES
jgi:magnesium and cobalt exporter, CNNM family